MKKLLVPFLFLFALFSPQLYAAPVTIKVAYESNPGEPADTVVKYWADLVKKESNGDIVFELYPSSQLGSKQDITEQALM
ncbi:C4-dicarboxylate ABC transporter, partial [Escherichia coli]|nr:C4-dicarboxylate ABC transporter [Escherichia coli]